MDNKDKENRKFTDSELESVNGGDAYGSCYYVIDQDLCLQCGYCTLFCPIECIDVVAGRYIINSSLCVNCGGCISNCPAEAVREL